MSDSNQIALSSRTASVVVEKLRESIHCGDVSALEAVLSDTVVLSSDDLKCARVQFLVLDWWCARLLQKHNSDQKAVTVDNAEISDSPCASSPDVDVDAVATQMMRLLLSDSRMDSSCLAATGFMFRTPLITACSRGSVSMVQLLLADARMDKAVIDQVDHGGRTSLISAASGGHTAVMQLLLSDPRVDKASIDHACDIGWTALISATMQGHTAVVELLLADSRVDKASIDHTDIYGYTLLMHAVVEEHTPIVELLLADARVDGSSIGHVATNGYTALTLPIDRDDVCAANMLIQHAKTRFACIVQALNSAPRLNASIADALISELTRRQMCVIYPSTDPTKHPVPDDDGDDGDEAKCALLSSFFSSALFDVNVLRIIREYAMFCLSEHAENAMKACAYYRTNTTTGMQLSVSDSDSEYDGIF
jgi:Ankyrin repeats (3 copies)/Ankyrin repeats (many copies)